MNTPILQNTRFIEVNADRGSFRVNRKVFADQAIFDTELERIFNQTWLYIGHESEIAKPNDFLTRNIARRPLIFARGSDGEIRCFLNMCPHRGATVEREKCGSAKSFSCIFHGWSWNNKGGMTNLEGKDGFKEGFNKNGEVDLIRVPRLESYRGFCFISFNKDVVPLSDFLAGAKAYIDLIVDQSADGMEVLGGTHEYSLRCNWKGMAENSVDIYHTIGTHPSYLDYLITANPGLVLEPHSDQGKVLDLGNGHGVAEYYGPFGRPVADWRPSMGEHVKADVAAKEKEVVARLGAERGERVTKRCFNLLIFPNLALINILAVAIRSIQPIRPNYMHGYMWALAPKDETAALRATRLNGFNEFFGPGGFATPDDIEALETCQVAYDSNVHMDLWNEVSKGLSREGHENWIDEGHMRGFWRTWNQYMTGKAA